MPLKVEVGCDSAVGVGIGVNPADSLPFRYLLAGAHFGDDVAVDGFSAAVAGRVVDGDPLAEPAGGPGAGDRAVFDGVDGLVS